MERAPHPLDDRGLPVIPPEIYEVDCGGERCEPGDVHCPDTHHLYAEKGRFAGRAVLNAFVRHRSNQVELLRCQHQEIHARFQPAPEPPREVLIEEIRLRAIPLSKKARRQI